MNVQDKFGTAIILSGGKSSRMGFDKQFLTVDEGRVIDILIKKLKDEFSDIVIVTNKPEEYKEDKYSSYKIVSDIIVGKGPLSGIHVGLKNTMSQYAYFIACDMPYVNLDYIRYMKKKITDSLPDACVSKTQEHTEVFNSFYSKDIIVDIERQLNEDKRSVNSLLKTIDTLYVSEREVSEFNKNMNMFMNLNTPLELEEFVKRS